MSTQTRRDAQSTSEDRLPPWPLRWQAMGEYLGAFALLTLIGLGVGFMITGPLSDSGLVQADREIARWFAEQRTPDFTAPSDTGSALANTFNIIAAVVVLGGLLTWKLRGWKESLTLITGLALEALVFLVVSLTVGRERPPVEQLDGSPPTASFPSGHTGAAFAFYLGVALIIWWRTDKVWLKVSAVTLGLAAAVIVAVSRMYRGMHFLTDVTMGALLGVACLAIAAVIVQRAIGRRHEEESRS